MITSLLRHFLSYLAGIGGLLATYALISPAEVPAANAAGAALIDPLTLLGGAMAAGATRLVLAWITAKRLSVADGNRTLAWVLWVGLAGLYGLGLPACAPGQMPLRGTLITDAGALSYSSKGGLEIAVDGRSGK